MSKRKQQTNKEDSVMLPIGARISFPQKTVKGGFRTIFATIVDHTTCPFTGKESAVFQFDGDQDIHILPHDYLYKFKIN